MNANEAFITALKAKPHGMSCFLEFDSYHSAKFSYFCFIYVLFHAEKVPLTKKMLDKPEFYAGPFFIVRFTDNPVNGRIYNGYRIMLQDQEDLRWCLHSPQSFQMWWLGGNEVQIPSTSYTFLHDPAAEQKGKTAAGDLNPRITQATNVARNAIKSDPDREYKLLLLELPTFSDEHKNLDNSV